MRSIYDSCKRTVASFEELLLTSEVSDHQHAGHIPVKDLTNEFGRFKVWAGSLGARISPQRRVSLDYRLQDSQFYKQRVTQDLDILDETLQKGNHAPRIILSAIMTFLSALARFLYQ